MSAATETKKLLKGGEWLVKESSPFDTFTAEDFVEEQKMIRDMCDQFLDAEVYPILDRIDNLEPGLMKSLLTKAGEQGLLSVAFPEEYGGLGKDFITATIVNEYLGAGHSFSVAIAAHTGIGTLPILYFGTPEQKQKYIPKLITGEWAGAYGLTEPNSGSDALGAKTTAKLSDDGKYYLLNGQKCWITNGGFAQVYTVFAKVDGDKFTGFIVEREPKDLPRDRKSTRWVSKVLLLFNCISRMLKYRWRTCWRDRQRSQDRFQYPEHRPLEIMCSSYRRRQESPEQYH